MTAIAYRNGTMAGDTNIEFGYVKTTEQKIVKKDGYLIGVSGSACPHNDDFIRWFFVDVKASRRLEMKGCEFEALVVTPTGKMQLWSNSGLCYPVPPAAKFWAVGSGAEVCMGAMEAGATAERAVAAAIKWAKGCGGKVTVKRLKGK
jgi:hypothetical protein